MTRSRSRFGFAAGGALAGALLAGSLLAGTAAAQTPVGPGFGPGVGPRAGGSMPCTGPIQAGVGPYVGAGAEHEAIAQALGISSDELYSLRASGKSIAQIADEKGVPLATVTDTILQTHNAWLDQRVQDGSLTQAQADAILGLMQTRIDAMVQATGVGPRSGMMGPRGGGPGFGPGFGPRFTSPTS